MSCCAVYLYVYALSLGKDNFLDCDFESDDYCNWVKDEDATAGTWKLISGKTPTRNTGPSYDTTLGEDNDGSLFDIFLQSLLDGELEKVYWTNGSNKAN